MGNIAPRAEVELTYLAFQANALTIILSRVPDVTTLTTPVCLCGSLFEMLAQTTTIPYIRSY